MLAILLHVKPLAAPLDGQFDVLEHELTQKYDVQRLKNWLPR